MPRLRFILPVALFPVLFASAAQAQFLRPPQNIPGADISQAQAGDAAGLMVRIDRLEGQLRQQNGQIEDMQFQIKRLEDQLRKFQQDVDFRFQDAQSGKAQPPAGQARPQARPAPAPPPGKRTDLNENGYPVIAQSDATPLDDAPLRTSSPARPARRSDAFDPDVDPTAPGAPLPLGQTPSPSVPPRGLAPRVAVAAPPAALPPDADDDSDATGQPMDLMHGGDQAPPISRPAAASPRIVGAAVGLGSPALPGLLETPPPPATPRDEFDAALANLRASRFDAAETGFRGFLDKHPKDRLAADATFYLGETYAQRSRPREAAEQYLKVSTDFEKSNRAPEALVKLGLSLEKLGAREQACAAYGEVTRKYPNASASIRASADRQSKRGQC